MLPRAELVFATFNHDRVTAAGPGAAAEGTKIRALAVHPVRSWVAVGDEHETVTVWDFERRALLTRFTVQDLREQQLERERIQQAVASGATVEAAVAALEEELQHKDKEHEKDHAAASGSRDLARAARQRRLAWAVQAAAARQRVQRQQEGEQPGSSSSLPPAGAGRKGTTPAASQGRFGAIEALAFVDAGAVAHRLRGPPATDDSGSSGSEWHLAVLLEHRAVLVDVVGGESRHILPFDLQKQTPTALAALSARYLAFGCSDGQVRVWDAWRWELAAPACAAHPKEVRLLRVLLPSPTSQSLRLLSLGLEGTALLWHAPVLQAYSTGVGGLDVEARGLRPIMRLEGSIPLPHHPAVPEFAHDEERDVLSVMDGNRIVSVWDLSSTSTAGSSTTCAGLPPSTPSGSSVGRNTPSPTSIFSSISSPRLFPSRSGRTTPRASAGGRETPPGMSSSMSLASPISSPKARSISQQPSQAALVSVDRLPILARQSRHKLPPPSQHQKEPVVGVAGALSFQWPSGAGGGPLLLGVSKTGILQLMGGAAAGATSSTEPSIQRQDSASSLASVASSAIDMAGVERESSAGSAARGGAAVILPLATLEELDLKPFFALAPSFPAGGSDTPAGGIVGEIERGRSGPAASAVAADGSISTIAQFLSHLKVTSIQQHPMRRHAYVLASTLGTFVFLLHRHPPAVTAALVPAWGPGHLVAFESLPAEPSAGGRLVKARVHLLDPSESSGGAPRCRTGVLHPETLLAGDLRPTTSGPGVPQAYIASLGGSTPEATRARQQAAGKRPDLLLSRSGRFAALHWGFPLNYFMLLDLQANPEAGGSRVLDRGPAASFAWFGGEDGGEERYAVLVPGQEARASGEQDAEKRKSLFKWRDKGSGKHDGAAAVYVPPELVFKALFPPPPPAEPALPLDGDNSPAAPAPTTGTVRVASLTVEFPEGFFPSNPVQVLGGGHPDFLLLGWSHTENAPPALETPEQLQHTSYQFIRLAPASGGDGAAVGVRRLQASKAGPVLPPVARLAWDNSPSSLTCPLVALSYLSHGTHIYRVIPVAQQQPQQSPQQRPASITMSGAAKGAKGGGGGQQAQVQTHALSLAASLTITPPTGGAEPPASLLWAYGTLFYTTQTSVNAVLLAASSLNGSAATSSSKDPSFIASEYGDAAAPRFLDLTIASHAAQVSHFGTRTHVIKGALSPTATDEVDAVCPVWRDPDDAGAGGRAYRYLHDAFRPSPAPLPPGPVQLLGLHEGALLARTALGRLHLLPLDHPTLRMGMLLGAGHVQRAVKWAQGLDPHHHDAVALQLFEPHGPAATDAAVQGLAGLSLALAIDLCIRHRLVAQLEALLFPTKEGATAAANDDSVVELLERVDHEEATDPLGLPSITKGPAQEAILHGGGSLPPTVPTLRRVVLFLCGHKRTASLRRLLDACRRKGRTDAASLVALLLGDKAASIEQALAAGRPEDAALLSKGAGALMLGEEDRVRINGIVDAWNRALELNPPAAAPVRIDRL